MPPGVVGDLEAGTTFESTLAARHHVSSAGREVLLFVLDVKHVSWAHNLLLNLDELGIGGRALGIAQTSAACTALFERVSPDMASCGHSSFLRKSSNATVARYLKTWRIRHDHVYHLWWQRWHYLGWAVRLGYNALSLDSDISVRADPYALFHGALAHRNLIVGLDSDASGSERPGAFPMINVGLVYCQRCQAGGPAHRVLTDVIRRVFAFFEGPLLWKTKSKHTMIAERVLWEQDLFRDALEHVAFGLPPSESRHARGNANPPEGGLAYASDAGARQRNWRYEPLSLAPAHAPQPCPWLPLGEPSHFQPVWADGGWRKLSLLPRGVAAESVAGLPLWLFSPWNVPPHGAACAGQWAFRPPPVMIGHLVGCTSKHLMMRQLGWWHYDVSAADMVLARGARSAGRRAAAGTTAAAAVAAAAAAVATSAATLRTPPPPPRPATASR